MTKRKKSKGTKRKSTTYPWARVVATGRKLRDNQDTPLRMRVTVYKVDPATLI
jgi:hypothetical protein